MIYAYSNVIFTRKVLFVAIQSRIDGEWVKEVCYYPLKISLPDLGRRAGLAEAYIYSLCSREIDRSPSLRTVDKVANAIEDRYNELHISPPDDIWRKLVIQERG